MDLLKIQKGETLTVILQTEANKQQQVSLEGLGTAVPRGEGGVCSALVIRTNKQVLKIPVVDRNSSRLNNHSNSFSVFFPNEVYFPVISQIYFVLVRTTANPQHCNPHLQELYSAIHRRRQGALDASTEESKGGNKTYVFDPNDTTLGKLKQHIIK